MSEPVEGGGAEQSVGEGVRSHGCASTSMDVAPLGEVEVGGDYVESRVKLPDSASPSSGACSSRPESDLRVSVGQRGAG